MADQAGNLYVAGSTGTSGWTSGGFDTSYGGAYDGFLARVNADGTLGWTSYIGGAGNDRVNGLAVDASGSLYVAGVTGSSGWASGGYDTVLGGSKDGFVAKATPEGALVWSSYVGGDGNESVDAAAVSQSGSLYVTGSTSSAGWVSGGFDTSYNEGTSEGFVAKLGRPPVPVVVEGTDVSDTIDVAVRGDQYVVTITGSHVYYELTEVASLSIYGRNGNDNITVTPDVVVAVSIYGGAGNDSVFGGSGDDLIEGGEGNDTLIAAAGNDTLYGHDGADRLYGQAGDDELYGNAGNDSAYGGDGCDVVFGQAGDDVLYGNFGNDTMQGGDGQDSVMGGLGVDSLLGGLGNDSIYGGDGSDTIDGNEGDDHLEGKGKADTLYGGSGNDTIIGGAGADLIMAEDGDDWIGAADQYFVDSVYGGAGWDVMEHDAGDLLEGVEVSVLG